MYDKQNEEYLLKLQEIQRYQETRIKLISILKEGAISSHISMVKEEDSLKTKVGIFLEERREKNSNGLR